MVPMLFEGRLPDLNIGTNDGRSAAASLVGRLTTVCERASFSSVVDGRFKGGYITRHYGQPQRQVHAVQLEMSQRLYMDEAGDCCFDDRLADAVRPTLRAWIAAMTEWKPNNSSKPA